MYARAQIDLQKHAAKLYLDTNHKESKKKEQLDAKNSRFNQVGGMFSLGLQNGKLSFQEGVSEL
jgi:hypothetical protein